jgi:hypothetical protein
VNRLEERYRRVLRLLPRQYRQAWADDMVAAFLESMQSTDPETTAYLRDYGRPSVAEVASVGSLAVRLRLGGVDSPPRLFAWGQAVRLAVLLSLLANAVPAAAGIAVTVWLSGRVGWLPTPSTEWTPATPSVIWQGVGQLTAYGWLGAYLALVLGHRRVAQGIAVLAVVPPLVMTAVLQFSGVAPLTVSPWATSLLDVLVVAAMAAFHRDAPPVRRRPWLVALPIGLLLVPVPLLVAQTSGAALRFLDGPGISCVLVTAAMIGYLAGRVPPGRAPGTPRWPLALTLLAAAALGLRLVTLVDQRGQVPGATPTAAIAVQIVAVLAVGVPLAGLARRALRRLPAGSGARKAPVDEVA